MDHTHKYTLARFVPNVKTFQSLSQNKDLLRNWLQSLDPQRREYVESELQILTQLNAHWCVYGDPMYPQEWMQLPRPPLLFYYQGHSALLSSVKIGIIGSRRASLASLQFAENSAKDLGDAGLVVVSGMARGIDGAAHKGALSSGTIGILGCGLDVIYPQEHAVLYKQVATSGLLLTTYPPGSPPKASHFPERNRLIASLSQSIIVIEAAYQSGSLGTTQIALELGKDIYAVPGFPTDPRFAGSLSLIKQGAKIFTDSHSFLEDICSLSAYKISERSSSKKQAIKSLPSSAQIEDEVLNFISHTPTLIDELIRKCHTSKDVVLMRISELEIQGRIQKISASHVVRV